MCTASLLQCLSINLLADDVVVDISVFEGLSLKDFGLDDDDDEDKRQARARAERFQVASDD